MEFPNQSEMSKAYRQLQKEKKEQKAIEKKAKNYYGDSKEYRAEWRKLNKRKAEPRQNTRWV